MIKNHNIDIKVHNKNLSYYKNYNNSIKSGDTINIDIKNLPKYSKVRIDVICDSCGKEKKIRYFDYRKITKDLSDKYYCAECKWEKTKLTNIQKYGVENVFQDENIKNKIKKTNIEKYGVEYYSMTNEYKEKTKNECLKKYGVDHPLKNREILQNLKNTNLKKYGVECTLQNDEVRLKIIKTNIKKYGVDVPLKNKEIVNKLIETNIDKYKERSPLQNMEVRKKSLQTLMSNYGVYNPMKSDIIKEKSKKTKIENILKKFENINIIKIDSSNYTFKCDCRESHEFTISSMLLYNRLKCKTKLCTVCNPINSYNNSGFQIDFIDFIKLNYCGEILSNNREIIKPYEIDIYLPELKLGFEFNGVYWHNELYKSNNYHLEKTELSEKNGIKLIHIYEDDWIYKQDIVKSRILNILGESNKIYARKCEIKEINTISSKTFLDVNHIQGHVGSKIKIGLFYENELVSLMTFGSLRKSMGQKSTANSYELLRFCNKLNTNVVGGASKLFKYFIEKYNPIEVISYADRSWSSGHLYKILGFKLEHKTRPNYYYVIDGIRMHRFNFRKDKLIKEGFDSNKTEHEIMLERRIYRIYDSGHLKFKFNS